LDIEPPSPFHWLARNDRSGSDEIGHVADFSSEVDR
jgi:hypothetical protein